MGSQQPPSSQTSLTSQLFYIGRNSRGNWVVQDQNHTCGGLFVDRAEAVRYAMFENGRRRQAVIMVPDILELDLNGARDVSHHPHAPSAEQGRSSESKAA